MTTLDLGLIGNSRTSALINRYGRIVWWCYPYFDSDPICCSLLQPNSTGAQSGLIDVQMDNMEHAEQHYERNTPVLVTRLSDAKGNCIEVLDLRLGLCSMDACLPPVCWCVSCAEFRVGHALRFAFAPLSTTPAKPVKYDAVPIIFPMLDQCSLCA